MAAVEIWPPGEFKKRFKTDHRAKYSKPYACGDPRCVRDDCQAQIGFCLYIYLSENEKPLEWKVSAKLIEESQEYGYRLVDDPHLKHLLNIPHQTYLIYRNKEWVEADVEATEVFKFALTQEIIYISKGVEISECKGLAHLMEVVNGAVAYPDDEDNLREVDSDGWTASSAFSYPYSEEESDIPAEKQGDENDFAERDDEIVPSSQGSSEYFYC